MPKKESNLASSKDTFWEKFHRLRRNKMPIESSLYEEIEAFHQEKREEFHQIWGASGERRLPKKTVQFYQEVFSTVGNTVNGIFSASKVPSEIKLRAKNFYHLPAKKIETLNDLFALDVFREKTQNLDIRPGAALRGISSKDRADKNFLINSYHFALHRPQRTEFMFLHEMIVGYLGNKIHNGGWIAERGQLPMISTPDYWLLPAYVANQIRKFLGISEAELIALHFGDSNYARKALPSSIQELMLLSAHLYWYLETYMKISERKIPPADVLSMLIGFFLIPSLELLMARPGLRQRMDIGKMVDARFFGLIKQLEKPLSEQSNIGDLMRSLYHFSEAQWNSSEIEKTNSHSLVSLPLC